MMTRAALFAGALASSFVSASALADEFAPRRFVADDNARALPTINESETANSTQWNAREKSQNAAFEMTSSGNTLRWRVKQNGASVAPATHTASKVPTSGAARTSFAEKTRASSRGQNAAAMQDPFGDRQYAVKQAQAAEPVEEVQDFNAPGQVEPAPLQDEAPLPPRRPMFGTPLKPAPLVPAEEQPEPGFESPLKPAPLAPAEEPPAPMVEQEAMGPNLRKYNDRNCAVDGKACEDFRSRVKSDTLVDKDDLIDITPPLVLMTDTEQQRDRSLANFKGIPSRLWRNRAGEVVADGRLREVAYRYAVIDDKSGKPVKIKLNQLGDDEQCFLAGWWNVPSECILGDEIHKGRDFIPSSMTWTASALCHKPNYFEEVQVERYGHTAGFFQPALSGAHFFVNIAVLPYKMGINPMNECQYALGYYRPGSCAPWMVPPIPLSVRGAAAQALVVGGLSPVIP